MLPLLVALTDGRAHVAMGSGGAGPESGDQGGTSLSIAEARAMASAIKEQHTSSVVIDTETAFLRLGLAQPVTEAMGTPCIILEELHSDSLADMVRMKLPASENRPLTPDEIQGLLQQIELT